MRRLWLMAAVLSGLAAPAWAENRVALVIGNDAYERLPAAQQLHNAVNDARTMKATLEGLGFKVAIKENIRRADLIDALSDFAARIGKDDIAFFFYAGHGVSLNGANYILPSDIPPPRSTGRDEEEKLTDLAVAETRITDRIKRANARIAVVVLDACRDNPLASPGGRSIGASRGLAPPQESRGVLSIYSAGAGQQALDNLGDADTAPNSVFTRVFARKLKTPGLGLREAAFETQGEVAALATGAGQDQVPGVYSQIIGEDVFLAGRNLAVAPVADAEQAAFDAAMQADTATALENFLSQHSKGPLAGIAGRELARLTRLAALPSPTIVTPTPPPVVNKEPAEFETAMQADSVEALDAFLAKGTKGPLADIARRERDRLMQLAALPPVVATKSAVQKMLGMEFSALSDDVRKKFRIKDSVKGVVVTNVDGNSPAADKGMQVGQVIVEIHQATVSAPGDIAKKMAALKESGKKSALLLVATPAGEERFLALALE